MRNKTGTLRELIREHLFISLLRACAESLASENASRLAAMERAEKNIKYPLENLQCTFHRLRQGGVDEELFDVVSGFEALAAEVSWICGLFADWPLKCLCRCLRRRDVQFLRIPARIVRITAVSFTL